MDSRAFLGLQPTDDPFRWRLPVTAGLCTNSGFLFGGAGLGAMIGALERSTGREVAWATSQYLSFARPPECLDIDLSIAVAGRRVTQARAVGRVGDREVLAAQVALGERVETEVVQLATMPDVADPSECPARLRRRDPAGTIHARLDLRVAAGPNGGTVVGDVEPGRSLLWASVGEVGDGLDATMLAIVADYATSGVGHAIGRPSSVRSLDNTLRVVRLVPTTWMLLDVRLLGVAGGVGHVLVHMFADDGTLVATAGQSLLVRDRRD